MSTLYSEIKIMKEQKMTSAQIASVYNGKYSPKYIDEMYAKQRDYNLACTFSDDDERVLMVAKLREQRLKTACIAKELKLPATLVDAIIRTKDFYVKRRLTAEQKAMLRECAAKGMTIREAANSTGFKYDQVHTFSKVYKCKFISAYEKNRLSKPIAEKKHKTDESIFDASPLDMKSLMSRRWNNA